MLDERKKVEPNLQINNLVGTADINKMFSKGDTTNWSFKIYKITEMFTDTIPNHRIEKLPEKYNESLPKKTNLTIKENKDIMKKLFLN